MKKALYTSLLSLLACIPIALIAQPVNDLCSNATSLGTLATPVLCAQGSTTGFNQGATTTLTGQTNVGATSSAPYPYLGACGINLLNAPRDVWYTFVATGFQTTITVNSPLGSGTLTDPTITLWSGACSQLIGQGCAQGTGGSDTLTVFQTVIGQTYFIQVAGADSTQRGPFTLTVACANNCAGCLDQSYVSASPEPTNGGYAPGQTVTFCYTVTRYDQGSANWLHGITIVFGSGWDTSTLVIDSVPPSCTPTPGAFWAWYPNGETSSATGVYFGPGFYYETSSGNANNQINTDPGDNFGDVDAGVSCSPTFCVTITAFPSDTPGSNLNIVFNTSGDGESGSWTDTACGVDPSVSVFVTSTCSLPIMTHQNTYCNMNNGADTATPVGLIYAPFIFHWSNGYVDTTNGAPSIINNLAPGAYTVTVVNALNCSVSRTDTVHSGFVPDGGITQYVSCPSEIDSVVMTASGPGVWSQLTTNPGVTVIANVDSPHTVVSGFTAFGTYYYVWTIGCAHDTVPIIVTAHPNAGPDVFTCVNGTATMMAVGTGTWVALASNPVPTTITNVHANNTTITGFTVGGAYNYVWYVGNCTDTAQVIIPNFFSSAQAQVTVVCRNQTTNLTSTAGSLLLSPFSYTWVDSADVVSPHAASTATKPILAPTDFVLKVTSNSGCILYDTAFVNVSGAAPTLTVSPSDNNVCPGDTITLSSLVYAENLVTCGIVDTCVYNNLNFSVAVNNDTTSTTGGTFGFTSVYGSPFMGSYNSYKAQYLFTKAELNAAGLSSGSITDISFFVKQLNSTSGYDTFSVNMGCTTQDSLTGFVNNLYEVLPPQSGPFAVFPNQGWTPLPLVNYFNWDGASNLIVQVCYTNNPSNFGQDDFVSYSTTTYNGSSVVAGDDFTTGVGGCSLDSTADLYLVVNTRPNIKFGMCAPNVLTYQWAPLSGLCDTCITGVCDTCPSLRVVVNANTTYSLTVNDLGCANTDSVVLLINTHLALNATPDTTLCGLDSIQLHVSLANPPSSGCVQGYDVRSIPFAAISGNPTVIQDNQYVDASGFPGNTDDGTAGPLAIGFTFPFYCQTYTQFYVNTNGWLTFQFPYPATTNAQEYTAQTFPPVAADLNPQKVIELMMGNYDLFNGFSGSGTIGYFITGGAPNRTLVVQFNNMGDESGTYTTTGEMHLHETSGIIDILITNSDYSGTNHTTGVKDSTGLGTAAPGMNNQQYTVTTPVAWRFTPDYGAADTLLTSVWTPATLPDSSNNPYVQTPVSQTYYVSSTLILNQFTQPSYCVVRDSVRVTVSIPHDTLTSVPAVICPGDTAQLAVLTTDSLRSIQWSPVFGLSNPTIATPKASLIDSQTYYVTVVNSHGCKAVDTLLVAVIQTPHPALSEDSTVCYSDSVLLSTTGGASGYQWYAVDPTTGARTLVSSGTSDLTYYGHPGWDYVVVVPPLTGQCPYYSNVVSIDSFPRQSLAIDTFGATAFCLGGHVVLESEQGVTGVQWTPAIYGSQTSFPVTAPGTFSYTARDANGCLEYSNTITVVVSAPPAVTIGPYTNPICSGTTDTIVATALPASTVITWVPQAAGDTLVTATPGTYQLQAASPGCTFDTSIVLIAAPSPAVSLPGPYTTCAVDTVVTATPTGGTPGYTYVWSNGGTGPTTIDSILGSSQYSVVVTDANHCTAVSNTEVITTSYPGVAISISPVSDSIFIGDTAVLTATPVGTTAYAYLWSGSATTTVITPMSPVSGIIGDSLGVDTVYLLVTDKANGCTYATYAVINVVDYGMFAMPTAFTPNGDMKNDFFYPAFNGPNSPAHVTAFRIYDRWGQMIYNNPAAPGWDGNYGGTAQPSETYMYFVTIEYPDQNDASRMLQRAVEGSFQLLR